MTRGVTTLETMVRDLRLETRRSPDRNIGQDEYETLKRVLYRTQVFLYWDFDWPFLKVSRDITMQEDTRYYDFDEDIFFERMSKIRGNGNGQWKNVVRGIEDEDYDIYDSDNGQTSYPVEKWDIIDAGSGEQMEVWPVPSQDGETIRLRGYKKLGAFTGDNDVCTLDNDLIVLFAAAHITGDEDRDLSQKLLAQANRMYLRMRGGATRREGQYTIMGGEIKNMNNKHNNPQILAVHNSTS